jgi:DNA-binding MarR family transcriptional regulator
LPNERKPARPWITRIENKAERREKLVSITQDGIDNFKLARKDYKLQISKAFLSHFDLEKLLNIRSALFQFNISLDPRHDPGDSVATDNIESK